MSLPRILIKSFLLKFARDPSDLLSDRAVDPLIVNPSSSRSRKREKKGSRTGSEEALYSDPVDRFGAWSRRIRSGRSHLIGSLYQRSRNQEDLRPSASSVGAGDAPFQTFSLTSSLGACPFPCPPSRRAYHPYRPYRRQLRREVAPSSWRR